MFFRTWVNHLLNKEVKGLYFKTTSKTPAAVIYCRYQIAFGFVLFWIAMSMLFQQPIYEELQTLILCSESLFA